MSADFHAILERGGPWQEARVIGGCLCLLGDCAEILPALPTVDAVVTDPPYGIGEKWTQQPLHAKNGNSRLWGNKETWDDAPVAQSLLDACRAHARWHIMWGGNYYAFPTSRAWLVWDKKQAFAGSECELAWTNLPLPPRVFRLSRIDAYVNNIETVKSHPTEKPLALMRWCLGFIKGQTILDPFAGSFTTGVACIQLGRCFIGIEIDPQYYEIGCSRIAEATRQGNLFVSSSLPAEQLNIFEDLRRSA